MGNGTTQPTTIDEDLYERFKEYVEDKHGQTRGVLREELETALRNHLNADNPRDPLARIENDVATIKAQLATEDGGEVVPEPCGPPSPSTDDTHTYDDDRDDVEERFDELDSAHPANEDGSDDTEADDEPPEPPHRRVSSVTERARYIIEHGEVVSTVIEDAHSIKPRLIEDAVDEIWGYAKDETTRKVVDAVAEQLDAHPYLDPVYDDEWKLYFGDESVDDGVKTKPGKTGADAMAFIRRESKKSF